MAHEEAYSFKSLLVKQFPKVQKTENSEEKHWGKYQFPLTCKEHSVITSINFSPTEPHDYVVTSGSRVNIYSHSTNVVKKSISRFHEAAYSGQFRRDGRLVIAGEEQGNVKVFDVGSRDILRQCKEHKKAVHYTSFSLDGLKLMSCSDDTTIRCWDLATATSVVTMREHADYVRTGGISQSDGSLWFTGSYDHLVKLWDIRTGQCVQSLCHGAPLECVLVHPAGGICFSAGSNVVKVWDVLAGGRLLASFSNHQKTITSLCFDGSYRRLLSAGLDRQVKVYAIEDYHVKCSMSYPAAILSMGISPTDSHLVIGMTNKLLSIKCMRKKGEEEDDDLGPSAVKRARAGSYKYFMRGMHYKPAGSSHTVENKRQKQLTPYENYLKKFKYHDALDSVLQSSSRRRGVLVYSLLQELSRRSGLRIAVSGRTEEQLLPLLQYLCKFMLNPKYSAFLCDIILMILDIYGQAVQKGSGSEAVLKTIKVKVDLELRLQRKCLELLGATDMLLAASTINLSNVGVD